MTTGAYSFVPSIGPARSRKALNILILEKVLPYPPALSGDAVYSRGIIEALSQHAHVTVLCAANGGNSEGGDQAEWHITAPRRNGTKASILSRWPLIAWKGALRDYGKCLDALLARKWDAIVLDNLGTVHALPKLQAYRRRHPSCALLHFSHEYEFAARQAKYDAYDMSMIARLATKLDLAKIRRSEGRLLHKCDLVTVLNTSDAEEYRKIAPHQRYLLLTPGYSGRVAPVRIITPETPRRVLLWGGRRSVQKQQVLLDWLQVGHPILTRAGIETQVIGDIPDTLRNRLLSTYPDLDVRGFVDDPTDLVLNARAGLVVDTLGGGFKLRLLDHVFNRLPIIGLADAIDGLPTAAGGGYLAAADHAALANMVVAKIDDLPHLNAIMQTAFSDCSGQFSWDTRARALINALGGTSAQKPAAWDVWGQAMTNGAPYGAGHQTGSA